MIWTSTKEVNQINASIKLAIVQKDENKRKSLEKALKPFHQFQEIRGYSSGEELIKYARGKGPDVVIFELGLDDSGNLESMRRIKRHLAKVNIIVMADSDNSDLVFNSLNAGACGFILSESDNLSIMEAIEEAAAGGAPLSSKIARMVVESFQRNLETPLSTRETEVLQLLSKGKSYTTIADELFIHKETVKSHIKNIYLKLKVKSKAEAIDKANRDRLI